MVGAKHLFVDGQCTLVERFGLAVLALVTVEQCQLVECMRYIGMVGAKHLLTDGEGALVEGFGLSILGLLMDGEGTLVERLGLAVLALVIIEHCQIIETERYVGMIGAKHLLTDGEGTLVEGLGFSILCTLMQVVSCSIEQMSSFRGRDIPL